MGSSILSLDRLKKIVAADKRSILFARYAYMLMRQKSALDKAISLAEDGVTENPGYVAGRMVLAECYRAAGKQAGAELQLRELLKIEPYNCRAIDLLAQISIEEGNHRQAEHLYEYLSRIHATDIALSGKSKAFGGETIADILGFEASEMSVPLSGVTPASSDSGWGDIPDIPETAAADTLDDMLSEALGGSIDDALAGVGDLEAELDTIVDDLDLDEIVGELEEEIESDELLPLHDEDEVSAELEEVVADIAEPLEQSKEDSLANALDGLMDEIEGTNEEEESLEELASDVFGEEPTVEFIDENEPASETEDLLGDVSSAFDSFVDEAEHNEVGNLSDSLEKESTVEAVVNEDLDFVEESSDSDLEAMAASILGEEVSSETEDLLGDLSSAFDSFVDEAEHNEIEDLSESLEKESTLEAVVDDNLEVVEESSDLDLEAMAASILGEEPTSETEDLLGDVSSAFDNFVDEAEHNEIEGLSDSLEKESTIEAVVDDNLEVVEESSDLDLEAMAASILGEAVSEEEESADISNEEGSKEEADFEAMAAGILGEEPDKEESSNLLSKETPKPKLEEPVTNVLGDTLVEQSLEELLQKAEEEEAEEARVAESEEEALIEDSSDFDIDAMVADIVGEEPVKEDTSELDIDAMTADILGEESGDFDIDAMVADISSEEPSAVESSDDFDIDAMATDSAKEETPFEAKEESIDDLVAGFMKEESKEEVPIIETLAKDEEPSFEEAPLVETIIDETEESFIATTSEAISEESVSSLLDKESPVEDGISEISLGKEIAPTIETVEEEVDSALLTEDTSVVDSLVDDVAGAFDTFIDDAEKSEELVEESSASLIDDVVDTFVETDITPEESSEPLTAFEETFMGDMADSLEKSGEATMAFEMPVEDMSSELAPEVDDLGDLLGDVSDAFDALTPTEEPSKVEDTLLGDVSDTFMSDSLETPLTEESSEPLTAFEETFMGGMADSLEKSGEATMAFEIPAQTIPQEPSKVDGSLENLLGDVSNAFDALAAEPTKADTTPVIEEPASEESMLLDDVAGAFDSFIGEAESNKIPEELVSQEPINLVQAASEAPTAFEETFMEDSATTLQQSGEATMAFEMPTTDSLDIVSTEDDSVEGLLGDVSSAFDMFPDDSIRSATTEPEAPTFIEKSRTLEIPKEDEVDSLLGDMVGAFDSLVETVEENQVDTAPLAPSFLEGTGEETLVTEMPSIVGEESHSDESLNTVLDDVSDAFDMFPDDALGSDTTKEPTSFMDSLETTEDLPIEEEELSFEEPLEEEEVVTSEDEINDFNERLNSDSGGEALPSHVLTPTFANIYLQQDQPHLAKQIYERLLEKDPDNDDYIAKIAEISEIIKQQQIDSGEVPDEESKAEKKKKPLKGVKINKKNRERLRKKKDDE